MDFPDSVFNSISPPESPSTRDGASPACPPHSHFPSYALSIHRIPYRDTKVLVNFAVSLRVEGATKVCVGHRWTGGGRRPHASSSYCSPIFQWGFAVLETLW